MNKPEDGLKGGTGGQEDVESRDKTQGKREKTVGGVEVEPKEKPSQKMRVSPCDSLDEVPRSQDEMYLYKIFETVLLASTQFDWVNDKKDMNFIINTYGLPKLKALMAEKVQGQYQKGFNAGHASCKHYIETYGTSNGGKSEG